MNRMFFYFSMVMISLLGVPFYLNRYMNPDQITPKLWYILFQV